MSLNRYLFVASIAVALAGCVSAPVDKLAPIGFAEFEGSTEFLATSPDRVVFRVREFKNNPYAELSFWELALKSHMSDSGYQVIAESSIDAISGTGQLLELGAPIGQVDYRYLLALFVTENTIYLVEAAGEVKLLNKRREAILAAISGSNFT